MKITTNPNLKFGKIRDSGRISNPNLVSKKYFTQISNPNLKKIVLSLISKLESESLEKINADPNLESESRFLPILPNLRFGCRILRFVKHWGYAINSYKVRNFDCAEAAAPATFAVKWQTRARALGATASAQSES